MSDTAEVVTVDDLAAGDVVSFDGDPERLVVDGVYDLDPPTVDVLFAGWGMPSPFEPATPVIRWACRDRGVVACADG